MILSFEGPDLYSQIGGLAVRVTELAHALGEERFHAELIFVGDPKLPAVEEVAPNVVLRRWGQWISAYHPANVYDGEIAKVNDFTSSVPAFIVEHYVAPAAQRGERVLIIAEEWQTVAATIALDRLLRDRNLRGNATIMWNANNTYGFEMIDWVALSRAATITCVSKYMKFELSLVGAGALVIPNGIPPRLLEGPPAGYVASIRSALPARPLLAKIGRFSPDKNWMQAIDAVAELRKRGFAPRLIVRGGREEYGREVFAHARALGLGVEDVTVESREPAALFEALAKARAEVVNLRSFLTPTTLYSLYAAADAVLANSGKEPFGLVGLEVMAAGGLAVLGATGEEYAEPFVNAIVCDTGDGRELAAYLSPVVGDPIEMGKIREAGRETARRSTWPTVVRTLEHKLDFVESTQS